MLQTLGMKIAYMTADEQDHSTAFISHLPHAAAFALANAVLAKENREIIFDLASGGFNSTVRLAKSSPEMWGPIFQQNKEYIVESLDVYIKHLKEFKKSIENDEKQMKEHVKILSEKLSQKGIIFKSINLAYQSKVGPLKWLEPSLENMLKNFKNENVIIYPIAFIVDNSETDFELDIEYREIAHEIGIKNYQVCKCVNDSDDFIEAIKDIIK
jgi:hypothetical protein